MSDIEIENLYQKDSGLIAHYSFDNDIVDSNNVAIEVIDDSGHGHSGAPFGNLTYTSGVSGNAASFNGVDRYISIQNQPIFNNSSYSLVLWVKANSPISTTSNAGNGWTYLLAKGTDYDFQYGVFAHESLGLISATSWAPAGASAFTADGNLNTINDGSWHQLVGIMTDSYTSLYVDGQLIDTDSSLNQNWNKNGNANVTIGGINWASGTGFFNGKIDEVRIYNRALSDIEIENLYRRTLIKDSFESGDTSMWESYTNSNGTHPRLVVSDAFAKTGNYALHSESDIGLLQKDLGSITSGTLVLEWDMLQASAEPNSYLAVWL